MSDIIFDIQSLWCSTKRQRIGVHDGTFIFLYKEVLLLYAYYFDFLLRKFGNVLNVFTLFFHIFLLFSVFQKGWTKRAPRA
jgi:ABC-type uncharacterized transport system permease subunit